MITFALQRIKRGCIRSVVLKHYNSRKLEQRAATVSPKWLVKKEGVKVVFRLGTIQVILRTTCRGRE